MDNYALFSQPPQKLSSNKKTKEWYIENINAIAQRSSNSMTGYRSTYKERQIAYDLLNGIINTNDPIYRQFTEPYGDSTVGKSPGTMLNINLIKSKVDRLKGESIMRPFNFQVIGLNGGAASAKEDKKREILTQAVMAQLASELGISLEPQIDPNTGQPMPVTIKQVEEYMSLNYMDLREKWGNDILKYLEHQQNLPSKFIDGFERALISSECTFRIDIINENPVVRIVNDLAFDYDFNPDDRCIENSDWFREERIMTRGQILDEFKDYLTDADVEKLDKGQLGNFDNRGELPGFLYSMEDLNKTTIAGRNQTNFGVSVIYCTWKGMKMIVEVSYPDENGVMQSGVTDESFKLTPELEAAGYTINKLWIPEFYSGVKIGDIYVKYGPEAVQFRSMDDPSKVKAPYVGRVFNSLNSKQVSLVQALAPHQYLYDITWYKLIQELAKAKGKKMVFDIAQIPKSEGMDLDKWMYMFDNVGIAFINSFEEGPDRFQNQPSNFNQFTALDLTLSQSVGQYINILTKIEQIIDKISGISPQREGDVSASESATGVNNAITQSSFVTEPFFNTFNDLKISVLESLLEASKIAFPENKKLHYIVDDTTRVMLSLDMEKFADSDYGLFVSNSSKDNRILSKIESLGEHAISTGSANLSDLAKIYKAQSAIEVVKLLEDAEKKKQEQAQQQQQHEQEMQQAQLQANQEEKDKEREFIASENQLDRQMQIQKAVISTVGFDSDTKDNGIIDVVAEGKLALDKSKADYDNLNKERDRLVSMTESEKDRNLEREKLSSKEKIEKLKAQTALKNKTVGEK